ncbi:hypothetical protein JZ751_006475 [Albula glossodonta]|uniref:C-type lectin domain-containing protein n=1 Tax=Albula glossodonta TaxID=121402 RepID=A0A8T2NAU7_9TELE|nr:hypothetical protein JZ751_006475 [Albula glossodonta]
MLEEVGGVFHFVLYRFTYSQHYGDLVSVSTEQLQHWVKRTAQNITQLCLQLLLTAVGAQPVLSGTEEGKHLEVAVVSGRQRILHYCREHHKDLAGVMNQAENQEIKQTAGGQEVWIGLFRGFWKWSDQSSSSYCNWSTGQPDNAGWNENCAVVSATDAGRWNDLDCNEPKPFVCYEENLVLVCENKSWDEALSYCRQHDGDLASVSTEQLQHWVKRRAQSASTAHLWLGLRYSCVLHFWVWVSGEECQYQNWAPGNETGECGHRGAVESGAGKQWVSLPKTEELNFICIKCGALNMNDPAVGEAVLQQMMMKLAKDES